MKFIVSKVEIQKKLSNIQGIVDRKNITPVLSHFLLNAAKDDSYIVATDLEITLREPLHAEVETEGKLCIPARKLFKIVREVDTDLLFESTDDQWLRIKCGASDFRLACLPASEFPAWPVMEDVEEITIDATVLMEMIEKTIYSAGESDTRYTLNGLLFYMQPESRLLTVVGTDGHRLATINKNIDREAISSQFQSEKKVIVPRKAASELRRFLNGDKVKITFGKNHLSCFIGEVQFLTRLIDGQYIDYDRVILKTNRKKASIERNAFIKALNRVSVMSDEAYNTVRLDLAENLITLSSLDLNIGQAKDEVLVDYEGDEMSIAFNARYLLDALKVMTSEKVIVELNDSLSPTLLTGEKDKEWKYIVMPIRI